MREVIKFEADDGTVFDNKEDAENHDKYADIKNWYVNGHFVWTPDQQNPSESFVVPFDDAITWLSNNKEDIRRILDILTRIELREKLETPCGIQSQGVNS